MKIISLQSVGIGDASFVVTNLNLAPMAIRDGDYYPGTNILVTLIELTWGAFEHITNNYECPLPDVACFKIVTADGHFRLLPEQSYIAEWVDDEDGDSDA